LPFADDRFDLVIQYTMFSSIMSPQLREAAAAEMLRVLRPDGRILWYDIRKVRRRTPGIHPIREEEVVRLFPACDVVGHASTLRWDVLRRTVPVSRHVGLLLERVRWLDSHYLAAIRPSRTGRMP
jgi:SAM-dependent methyltransferase